MTEQTTKESIESEARWERQLLARRVQVAALAHRIEPALDSGQQAFWAVMVEHFPEVEAGDFGPEEQVALDEALKDALRLWLYWNLPTPEQA